MTRLRRAVGVDVACGRLTRCRQLRHATNDSARLLGALERTPILVASYSKPVARVLKDLVGLGILEDRYRHDLLEDQLVGGTAVRYRLTPYLADPSQL